MPLIYNIEPFQYDLIFIKGDTINLSLDVLQNGVAYVMTGMTVKVQFRRLDGKLVKSLTSTGGTIIILVNNITLYDDGFIEEEMLRYDVQVTNLAGDVLTIGRGSTHIIKETTT